jgi:hypothetical protein
MPTQCYYLLLENTGFLLLESGGKIIIAVQSFEAGEDKKYNVRADARTFSPEVDSDYIVPEDPREVTVNASS